jgi:hypothetical protein
MAEQFDSFTKAMVQFNEVFGTNWQRHIHPQDRDEMCGYLIRMLAESVRPLFNVWNATTNRPHGVDKLSGCVKTLIKTQSGRRYYVEAPTRELMYGTH